MHPEAPGTARVPRAGAQGSESGLLGVSPCNSPPPARLLFDGCRSGSADHDVPTLRGILLVSALDGPGNVRAGDVRSGAGDVPTLSRRLKVREARLQLPLAGSARVEQESCSAGVVSATDSLRHMPRLASFPAMMQRGRKREGLRVCRAAWLVGVSVREYREIEASERSPTFETWDRICKLNGWPQTFVGSLTRRPHQP